MIAHIPWSRIGYWIGVIAGISTLIFLIVPMVWAGLNIILEGISKQNDKY